MPQIGLLGLGTVGQGVYEIINMQRGELLRAAQSIPTIKKVLVRDASKQRGVPIPEGMLTENVDDILNDPDISIVVAVTGSGETEHGIIRRALAAGKHVVTANKDIMSRHADKLLELAKANGVHLLFEASVGGGIPIIGSLSELLKINRITKIQGILNGTTNFILTKIAQEGKSFADALAEAQQLGFAEADPTADVEGLDVMRKISILAAMCFQTMISAEDVHLRGIGNITLEDVKMAEHFGYKVKYIGQAISQGDGYSVSVTPVLIDLSSVVANVNQEYNVILVSGDIIGDLCFMGKGAGKDATANAVVSDILKIMAGDFSYDHIRFDSKRVSSGLAGIQNEYYIRVSIDFYEQFAEAINLISDTVKKDKLIFQDGKLYFLTEELNSTDMKSLYEKLREVASDVFYARLDHSLL